MQQSSLLKGKRSMSKRKEQTQTYMKGYTNAEFAEYMRYLSSEEYKDRRYYNRL